MSTRPIKTDPTNSLRALRASLGLTQETAARLVGASQECFSYWERAPEDRIPHNGRRALRALADYATLRELATGEQEEQETWTTP